MDQNLNKVNDVIVVKDVFKMYGGFSALKGISFSVKDGEIVGFLGPNGAGKTTTMNILTGCISYTSGKIEIFGCDIFDDSLKAKKNIGYLPENPPLYINMTVFEYLKFVCNLKKVKEVQKEIERVVGLCGLESKKDKLIISLSKGFKQRVGIAQALVGSPKVLILDEPTSGLDPAQIVEVRNLIRSLKKEHTIILSTHILSEIQAISDRIIIINDGEIVADETEENLLKAGSDSYFLKVYSTSKEKVYEAFKELSNSVELKEVKVNSGGTISFEVVFKEDLLNPALAISNAFLNNKIPIVEFFENKLTLEQLFISLIEKKV